MCLFGWMGAEVFAGTLCGWFGLFRDGGLVSHFRDCVVVVAYFGCWRYVYTVWLVVCAICRAGWLSDLF